MKSYSAENEKKIRIIIFVIGLSVSGCMKATLQVTTNPSGALVTELNGNAQGISPAKFSYDFKNEDMKSDGCFHVNGFKATWPSGASNSTDILRLCPKGGLDFTVNIQRPTSYPGLDVDLANSYQAQQLQIQKEQYQQQQMDRFNDSAANLGYGLGRVLSK